MLRLDLTSVLWHWKHRHRFKLISRPTGAAACSALAGGCVLAGAYWRAVLQQHLTLRFVPAKERGG